LRAESKLESTRPKNPSSWWKVYRKLKREDEAATQEAEDRLKATLNRHKVDKGAKQTHIVHAVIPSGEKRPVWNSSTPRDKPFGSQALKNARTTAQTITVLKRQTAQRQAGRSVAQSVPMHQLSQLRGKVNEAPAHMIRNYAQKPGPTRPPVAVPQNQAYRPVFARQAPTYADRALTTAINLTKQEQEAKERRLLALTSGSSGNKPRPAAATSVSRPPTASAPQRRPSPLPAPRPTPVPTSSTSGLARKRPAYDPFLPSKKRRT
jgi:elongin-A